MSPSGQEPVELALDVVDPADREWGAFVAGHPDATCFHQPAWLETLTGFYGLRGEVAVQRNAEGAVVAGIPFVEVRRPLGRRRWSCLPFTDECGALVGPGGAAEPLYLQLDALRRQRGADDLDVRSGLEVAGAHSRQVGLTHALHLSGTAEGGGRPRASVRRHIAAARRMGVEVQVAQTIEDAETYYGLHVETRRRQGVPAQPRRFFRLLWERMIAPGHGFVLIARHDGRAVAGAVYLHGGQTVTYKYGASDAAAWPLRPNHAVMSLAIARATEEGFSTFDLGRTDLDNEGLARFKESWGAQRRPLRYSSFSRQAQHRSPASWSHVMAPVIRRSPSVVCRGLGELLYRYAA